MSMAKLSIPKSILFLQNSGEDELCIILNKSEFLGIHTAELFKWNGKEIIEEEPYYYPDIEEGFPSPAWSYSVLKHGEVLVFAPCWYVDGSSVYVYSISSKTFRVIPIEKRELLDSEENIKLRNFWVNEHFKYISSPRCGSMFLYEESVYVTPRSYPTIIKINLQNESVEYFDEFLNDISIDRKMISGAVFDNAVQVSNKIYFAYKDSNILVEFDMKLERHRIIELGEEKQGNSFITVSGNQIWCFSSDFSKIFRWDSRTEKIEEYDNLKNNAGEFYQYSGAVCKNNYLYLCHSNKKQDVIMLNTESGELCICEEFIPYLARDEKILSFGKLSGNIFISTSYGKIYEWSENIVEQFDVTKSKRINEYAKKQTYDFLMYKNSKFYENSWFDLSTFISVIS